MGGSFRVVTDAVADDGSPLYTYPLRRHADELERIEQALLRAGHEWIQSLGDAKAAAGLLTPAPPPPLTGLSCSLIPASLVGYRPHYGEGGGYVLALRPDWRHFANSRDAWAAEIADAAHFLTGAGIRTDGLPRYHAGATSLLDARLPFGTARLRRCCGGHVRPRVDQARAKAKWWTHDVDEGAD